MARDVRALRKLLDSRTEDVKLMLAVLDALSWRKQEARDAGLQIQLPGELQDMGVLSHVAVLLRPEIGLVGLRVRTSTRRFVLLFDDADRERVDKGTFFRFDAGPARLAWLEDPRRPLPARWVQTSRTLSSSILDLVGLLAPPEEEEAAPVEAVEEEEAAPVEAVEVVKEEVKPSWFQGIEDASSSSTRATTAQPEPLQAAQHDIFAPFDDGLTPIPSEEQQEVVLAVLGRVVAGEQVTTVAGPAGTGKTTLLRYLARALQHEQLVKEIRYEEGSGLQGEIINIRSGGLFILAPTNRAARVIRGKLPECVDMIGTIHAYLYIPSERVVYEEEPDKETEKKEANEEGAEGTKLLLPLGIPSSPATGDGYATDYDAGYGPSYGGISQRKIKEFVLEWTVQPDVGPALIIIDEASMVTQELADDLLSTGAQVIAVGDGCQLPPVGGPAGFDLLNPTCSLTKVFRQETGSVLNFATEIRLLGSSAPADPRLLNDGAFCQFAASLGVPWQWMTWHQVGQALAQCCVTGEGPQLAIVHTHRIRRAVNTYTRRVRLGMPQNQWYPPWIGEQLVSFARGGKLANNDFVVVHQLHPRTPLEFKKRPLHLWDIEVEIEGGGTQVGVLLEPQWRMCCAGAEPGEWEVGSFIDRGSLPEVPPRQAQALLTQLLRADQKVEVVPDPKWEEAVSGKCAGPVLVLNPLHALTAWKAQGGEWPELLYVLDIPSGVKAEGQAWRAMYTGVTRAAKKVTVVRPRRG